MILDDAALITHDQARNRIGLGPTAIRDAIERGDLTEIEVEGQRPRRYITAASCDQWIATLNGQPITPPTPDTTETIKELKQQIAALSYHVRNLGDQLTDATRQIAAHHSQARKTQRAARLRHTITAHIGDATDPHGYYVYLLWGDDPDTPLYIGQSRNVLARLGAHLSDNTKRPHIRRVQLIKCAGQRTMTRTEAALIREYKPPLNIAGKF